MTDEYLDENLWNGVTRRFLITEYAPIEDFVTQFIDTVVNGWEPSGFMFWVMKNDLISAVLHADYYNRRNIECIVRFMQVYGRPLMEQKGFRL